MSILSLFSAIITLVVGNKVCPNTNPTKYNATICPDISPGCCENQYSGNGYGCYMPAVDVPGLNYCCLPGPLYPASSTQPNVMIMGDSVSNGYTPYVVTNTSSYAFVQHSPSGRDGGACNTSMGLSCFDIFMVTLDQKYIEWDLIQFNFGLHDLDNSSNAEQSYGQQLEEITVKLQNYTNKKAKLQYALTTPQMSYYNKGDYVVEDDNNIAENIMKKYNIPIVDLYDRVVEYCGPVPYVNCSICATEPCGDHYTKTGYQWISVTVNNEMKKQLNP